MPPRLLQRPPALLLLLALGAAPLACADEPDLPQIAQAPDDAEPAEDAPPDAPPDPPDAPGEDAPPDAPEPADSGEEDSGEDAAEDSGEDSGGEDAAEDAAEDSAEDAPPEDAAEDAAAPDAWDEDPLQPIPNTPAHAERPPNPTCAAPPRPPALGAVALEEVFLGARFGQTVFMLQPPGDRSRWVLGTRTGQLYTFDNTATPTVTLFADLTDRIGADASEKGLLGMAFSPDFATSGEVYISYTTPGGARSFSSRVSRFRVSGDGASLDRSTEEIVLSQVQPYSNHNGGHIAFGPDGYLYFGLGDGGSGGDPLGSGQDTNTLLGALLRLDVVGEDTYAIPPDNPFADGVGGRPELYAWGLRNPWRFSFDRATGDLWLGDVGQNAWEEVNLIQRGGNYGWKLREGAGCYSASTCPEAGLIDPVAVYAHGGAQRSITGGFVYHGDAVPALAGRYLYADFYGGPLWALGVNPATGETEPEQVRASLPFLLATFAQGEDGEVYLPAFDTDGDGAIYRLVPAAPPAPDPLPQLLSETGCVNPAAPLEPADGVIPYALNVPFWSDGAAKERFFALPDGAQLSINATGDLDFPIGSVLIKNFTLNGRRIETRLMVRHDDGGWGGYTYAWREDQTDAELLDAGRRVEIDGQPWLYPSRGQCFACHTAAAGFALGPELRQLNRDITWPSTDTIGNQLATFAAMDLLDGLLPEATSTLPALDNTAASDGAKARAWLHANCAGCHQPGNPLPAELDLRWDTPLDATNTCDLPPTRGDLGLDNARLIAPGDPARSVLLARVLTLDVHRMPPLGSARVDEEGAALLTAWIEGLTGCP